MPGLFGLGILHFIGKIIVKLCWGFMIQTWALPL